VADCPPFAVADFHRQFLGKRPLIIGCPKLDDAEFYVEKLAAIIRAANLRSLTVVRMERSAPFIARRFVLASVWTMDRMNAVSTSR